MTELAPLMLTLPYPPSKNRLHRRVGHLTLLSREARDYKDAVATALLGQLAGVGNLPRRGPLAVLLRFYRPRRTGDLDGRVPWVLDCLNGIAWQDDRQIVELHAYRADDKANPRVEVRVSPPTSVTAPTVAVLP